ncbi:MAG: hypothetical protein JWL89_548 [Candidatus Saccharibacteria bacterium]|jgi:hypothetical protein|nr:hypothetical protein [Candidatus Saccharibacteria bacterium]
MIRIPAAESFCRQNCPYFGDQLFLAEANANNKLPKQMCPRIAAVAVRGFAQNMVQPQPDAESEAALPNDSRRDEFIALAEKSAERYDLKASRCAKNIIRRGTDTIDFDTARSVTDGEVLDLFSAIGTSSTVE